MVVKETTEQQVEWCKTTFDGSRLDQLRRVQAMTVRERLEALDQLRALSERLQTMKRHDPGSDRGGGANQDN